MTKNFTHKPTNCLLCGLPIPLPRGSRQTYHPECAKKQKLKNDKPYVRQSYKKLYYARRIAGLCTKCGKPVVEAGSLCQEHLEAQKQSNQVKYVNKREWYLLHGAKARAKKLGLPFNLIEVDIVIPKVCPVLGIPLIIGNNRTFSHNSPSVDRLIPELGYVRGNVVVISWLANNIKRNFKAKDLEAVAKWMQSQGLE